MKHFKTLIAVTVILAALSLLAFGPRSDTPVPDRFTIVDYWEKWTSDEARQMKNIVDDFNNTVGKDKHIFVRFVSTSDIEQKTLVATAGGVPPDVAGLYDGNLVQFASLDALTPLDQLAAEHGFTAQTYKPIYWDMCHYDGHMYALICTPSVMAMHYNKKIMHDNSAALRAAGLDPDRPPSTVDELDAYAAVLDHRDTGGHMDRIGFLPTVPGWYLNQEYFFFGGHIWDPVHEKITLTDPAVIKAYTWVQSYSKRLGADAINNFKTGLGNFDSPQNEFLSGQAVFEQQGPWMANFIFNLNPKMDGLKAGEPDDSTQSLEQRRARMDWAVAPFPSAVPGLDNVSYCGFDGLVIPRGAKHPEEAFEFMAFVNRQDEMEKLCNMHSKNSPLQKVSQNFLNHSKNPYIDVFEKLADNPHARGLPQIPILQEVQDELINAIDRIVLLKATPEVALRDAQERLQEHYDNFAAKQKQRLAMHQ